MATISHTSTPNSLDDAQAAVVRAAIAELREEPGALLPILHAIQERLGFVPPASIDPIAHALNLSRAEVHGVVTFYHDFRSAPPGRHVLKVCRAEACQAVGCASLEKHIETKHTNRAELTVEPVYCLGNCALGPSVQLDGRIHGKVTPQRIDALLASTGRAKS